MNSGGECGAPRGREGRFTASGGASGGVSARGPGFPQISAPRARPSPPVFTLRKHSIPVRSAQFSIRRTRRPPRDRGPGAGRGLAPAGRAGPQLQPQPQAEDASEDLSRPRDEAHAPRRPRRRRRCGPAAGAEPGAGSAGGFSGAAGHGPPRPWAALETSPGASRARPSRSFASGREGAHRVPRREWRRFTERTGLITAAERVFSGTAPSGR